MTILKYHYFIIAVIFFLILTLYVYNQPSFSKIINSSKDQGSCDDNEIAYDLKNDTEENNNDDDEGEQEADDKEDGENKIKDDKKRKRRHRKKRDINETLAIMEERRERKAKLRLKLQKKHSNASYPLGMDSYDPLKGTGDFGNVLMIKVPKAGGTTLSITFQRYANLFNKTIGYVKSSFSVSTCTGSNSKRVDNWKRMVENSHGRIDVFASHGCYNTIMDAAIYPQAWKALDASRQLVVSIIREPWSRMESEYRYVQYRCFLNYNVWKKEYCGVSFGNYLRRNCKTKKHCSSQYHYVSGEQASNDKEYNITDISWRVLYKYHMIIPMERFSTGLVLLHLLYRLPWITIPFMIANENNSEKIPSSTPGMKKHYRKSGMQADVALYDAVIEKMDENVKLAGEDRVEALLNLLNKTNTEIKETCTKSAFKVDDCIITNVYTRHITACFHACMESVTEKIYEQYRNIPGYFN